MPITGACKIMWKNYIKYTRVDKKSPAGVEEKRYSFFGKLFSAVIQSTIAVSNLKSQGEVFVIFKDLEGE